MFRIIDDDSVDRSSLGVNIAAVWRIASLELAIRDSHTGQLYVVARQASYPLRDQISPVLDEGYWCFPNIAHPVQFAYSAPTTEASLAKLLAEHRAAVDLSSQVEQLAYSLGFRDVRLERIPGYIEVKNSPRTPSAVKAFAIERYLVTSVDPSCLANISDPESLNGIAFIPLDAPADQLPNRMSPLHDRGHLVAWGKPLMTSLELAVTSERDVSRYRANQIDISRDLFFYRESGILIAADLAGYGRALQFAQNNMRSFGRSVAENMWEFREQVTTSFERMSQHVGSSQQQMAGDGFIAGYPQRILHQSDAVLGEILNAWTEVLASILRLNEAIDDPEVRVGSRLALHYGDYSFGRVAGPTNLRPVFDGGAIVDVARIEQGTSAWMKSREPSELVPFRASDESLHIVAVSRQIPDWERLESVGLRPVVSTTVGSKEAHHEVLLCALEGLR